MSEHVRDLLSSYVDGALGSADRERVNAHLPECKECSDELEGLRKVSKMVSSLPQKDLPPGFMDRLKAKIEKSEEKPASFSLPFGWTTLSIPVRAAAFAATGILVCLITFREVKFRLAPAVLPYEDGVGGIAPMSAGMDTDVDRYMANQAASGARSRGDWSGLEQSVQSAPEASSKEDSGFLRRKMEAMKSLDLKYSKKGLRRMGSPMSAEAARGSAGSGDNSNEELQSFLQAERKRLGIQEIIPPSAAPDPRGAEPGLPMPPQPQGDAWEGVPDHPMSREEAMQGVRRMASNLSRMNENYRWQKNPTVPMDTGFTSKPKMLAAKDQSKPLGEKEAPPAKAADHLTSPLADKGGGLAAASLSDSFAMVKKEKAVRKPLYWTRSWSNKQGGMGTAGGAVIRRPDHFQDLWSRVKFEPALPAVDFNKDMIVAVFAERSETESRSVEVVSLVEEDGRLFIRFRVKTDESPNAVKPTDPYHIVIVPVRDLPYTFTQVE